MHTTLGTLSLAAATVLLYLPMLPLLAGEAPKYKSERTRQTAVIGLVTESWQFDSSQAAHSTLSPQTSQAKFAAPADAKAGFTVKLKVNVKKFDKEKTILEIPGVLSVRLRQHDANNRWRQNYPAFQMPDGSVPVLEASVKLHSAEHPKWNEQTIGIPLAMLAKPNGEHDVVLNFTGVRWTMYVDGELLDNDFPFGYPPWPAMNAWKMDGDYVRQAGLYVPAIAPTSKPAAQKNVAPVQYWAPREHNAWVGDIVTFFHQGRYHVFYLYDRRHHQSKFGQGAHYFEHLSTADFKTWTEHEAATPIEEQWECIGTGTPFVFNKQLCLAFGWHTDRIYPADKTTWPAQWDHLKKHGRTGDIKRGTTPGVPAGAGYAISADGVAKFKKTNVMFHPCMNPSVFTDPNGRLRMLANSGSKGIWESDSIDSGWRCISPDFPPGGDCTFFFRWGKHDYIIGGFRNLWSKPIDKPDSAYEDVVRKGHDFYDGLNVPAVTQIQGGRFLMAGWTEIRGWGGNLVIRELVQLPDGRIGSKWMDEITPDAEKPKLLAAKIAETTTFAVDNNPFLLSFRVQPAQAAKGKFGISFLPEKGDKDAAELQIRLDDQRAQFGPGSLAGFAPQQKSLHEGGAPNRGGNFAIENLIDVTRPFTVRIIVTGNHKIGGTLIDAEIAGKRTMITYRGDLTVQKLLCRMEGVELTNVEIAPLLK